jgi:hypothetical protein
MLSFNGNHRHEETPSVRSTSDGDRESGPVDIRERSRRKARFGPRVRMRISLRPGTKWLRVPRRTRARPRPLAWTASDELELELSRSRRFGHSFVLVRIPSAGVANGGPASGEDIAAAISALVRRVDKVWPEGAEVYVLLPECERGMAAAMLARIRSQLPDLLAEDVGLAISWAAFPEDGFTKRALLGAIERRSHPRRRAAPRVPPFEGAGGVSTHS